MKSVIDNFHEIDPYSLWDSFRVCLVCVKAFSENILFSENAIFQKRKCFHVFVCHKIRFTENQFWCLVHSNIFIENALHTQFSIHFLNCKLAHNESIPHSFTKETKPSKKIHQIRSNWDRAAEEKMKSRGEGEIGGEIGAIVRQAARSTIAIDERCDRQRSLFFLSLSPIWAFSSLSLSLSLSGNDLKWKWECKIISWSKE